MLLAIACVLREMRDASKSAEWAKPVKQKKNIQTWHLTV